MASGLPVVISRVGGNLELVNKKNGVLIPSSSSKKIAEAIIKLLENQKMRERMGQENRLRSQKFTWKLTVKQYFNIYIQFS
jgi:glycosyltransferase involved in cell wall biosynthesis